MAKFYSAGAVRAMIKAHLAVHAHRPDAFVDVHLVAGGGDHLVYVVTTEGAFVMEVQQLLEERLKRKVPYEEKAFVIFGGELPKLLG